MSSITNFACEILRHYPCKNLLTATLEFDKSDCEMIKRNMSTLLQSDIESYLQRQSKCHEIYFTLDFTLKKILQDIPCPVKALTVNNRQLSLLESIALVRVQPFLVCKDTTKEKLLINYLEIIKPKVWRICESVCIY